MTAPETNSPRFRQVLELLAFLWLLGGSMVFFPLREIVDHFRFTSGHPRIRAEVLSSAPESLGSDTATMVVRFALDDGTEHISGINVPFGGTPKRGQQIEIAYDPKQPDQARWVGGFWAQLGAQLGILIIGLVVLGFSGWCIARLDRTENGLPDPRVASSAPGRLVTEAARR